LAEKKNCFPKSREHHLGGVYPEREEARRENSAKKEEKGYHARESHLSISSNMVHWGGGGGDGLDKKESDSKHHSHSEPQPKERSSCQQERTKTEKTRGALEPIGLGNSEGKERVEGEDRPFGLEGRRALEGSFHRSGGKKKKKPIT